MRVLYDEFGFYQRHGGVSRYFVEVMKHLPPDVEWILSTQKTMNPYLQESPFCLPPMDNGLDDVLGKHLGGLPARAAACFCHWIVTRFPSVVPCDESRNRIAFNSHVHDLDFDVLHITAPHPRWATWRSVIGKRPIVATVHDLIPELFYGYDWLVKRTRRQLLADVDHVIAVSHHTKEDILKRYNVPEEKITVIHHGHTARTVRALSLSKLPENFILYVGKRCGCKNFDFFIRALVPILKQSPSLSLFCTGDPFTADEKKYFAEAGIRGQIIQSFVSEDEMAALFSKARLFVCPSKYEGFGMPILDAFAAGCPVVLARTSCLPEVGGDAALYFEDGDAVAVQRCISSALEDERLRQELINKGRERSNFFTWDRCAKETADIYRKVISEYNRRIHEKVR